MSTVEQADDLFSPQEEGVLRFTVLGEPQPAGSKRAFVNPKTGRAVITDDNRKAKPWQAEVRAAAGQVYGGELLRGPITLTLVFYRQRPKSHYRTGRNAHLVRDSAPSAPITRPDTTKLIRGVEDALTGVIWADDAQVTDQRAIKRYGEPARCEVEIRHG